ncbi:MAG: hypothetical protein RL637_1076 [Pseudomonadota bacterium]|jgi:flagellar biosynthesis regulator FlbT
MTTTSPALPQNFNECMTDCFTKMGTETRQFVINTIRIQFNELISSGQFNIEHYIQVINHLVSVLDGDDSQEGFQHFVQLVNDVNLLKQEHITQQQVTTIVQNLFANNGIDIHNNFVSQLVTNQEFINQIKSNAVIINSVVENLIHSLNHLPSGSVTDNNVNQFVAILNQLINSQVVQINQNVTTQVTQIRTEIATQIDQVNNHFSAQITEVNNKFSDFLSKKDLAAACAAACEAFITSLNGRVANPAPVAPPVVAAPLLATFFEHANYEGHSVQLGVGSYSMQQIGLPNDCISALKVPHGLVVTLYEHADYQGNTRVYDNDCSFVGNFNDVTSSIIIKTV